jgi:hypothetical protein
VPAKADFMPGMQEIFEIDLPVNPEKLGLSRDGAQISYRRVNVVFNANSGRFGNLDPFSGANSGDCFDDVFIVGSVWKGIGYGVIEADGFHDGWCPAKISQPNSDSESFIRAEVPKAEVHPISFGWKVLCGLSNRAITDTNIGDEYDRSLRGDGGSSAEVGGSSGDRSRPESATQKID